MASRAWIGWSALAVAAIAVGASFFVSSEEAPADSKPGAKRVTTVAAAPVARESITQRGRYPGELDADTADIAAFYAGRLVSVRVRVGDEVKAGDIIAELDPIDAREQIAQARAQAKAAAAEGNRARVERDAAAAEVARLEPLAKDKLISELEIDRQRARAAALGATVESAVANEAQAQANVKVLERRITESVVRAPFAGRVAERFQDPGAIVSAGVRLVRVVQVSPLRARFEVPEQDVARLRTGTPVRVETKGSDERVAASVSGIASEVSRERRVAIVEALVAQPPAGWLPGMYAEVTVELRTLEAATIVPAAAVLSRMQPDGTLAAGVFAVAPASGAGKVARWRPIQELARDGDRVAVTAELPPETQVLVAGHVDLSDGSAIELAAKTP